MTIPAILLIANFLAFLWVGKKHGYGAAAAAWLLIVLFGIACFFAYLSGLERIQ